MVFAVSLQCQKETRVSRMAGGHQDIKLEIND
nr:MAG TPA: hypothetical protein [Caudoviricetes sp.]